MKKQKIKVPAAIAGLFAQIGQAVEGLGTGIQDNTSKNSFADTLGTGLAGAANPAKAGLQLLGNKDVSVGNKLLAFTGIGSIFGRRQAKRAQRRRERWNTKFQGAGDATNDLAADFYSDYDQAYTFAQGGMTPGITAYVDDGEMIQTPDGNIYNVPEEGKPTDSNLVNLPEESKVLSDSLKVPGTKTTFADMANKLIKPRKTKGNDVFANNSRELNKRNNDRIYNELFMQQELLKAEKGIQPKYKALDDGGNVLDTLEVTAPRTRTGAWIDPNSLSTLDLNPQLTAPTPTYGGMPSESRNYGTILNNIGATADALLPGLVNTFAGLGSAEVETPNYNPYGSSVLKNLAGRRYNVEPAIRANARSRATGNYNAGRVSPNTGADLALRSQLAASEYAANADIYAQKQNMDNQYIADLANAQYTLGNSIAAERSRINEINAQNRAAGRNITRAGIGQISDALQGMSRDRKLNATNDLQFAALLPYLQQGLSSDVINNIQKQYRRIR